MQLTRYCSTEAINNLRIIKEMRSKMVGEFCLNSIQKMVNNFTN